jgi:arginine/lysine/ornithine decarboxylase
VYPIENKINEYLRLNKRSFHTPGHKGQMSLYDGIVFPQADLTELPGLDMLHAPKGIIAEAQAAIAKIFGADETFFLVNGGTVGNQATLLSIANNKTTANFSKGRIRVQRSAHRSIIAGLILSGLKPEYIPSIIHPEFKLPLGLDRQKFMGEAKDVAAFQVTDPSYYGTAVDLSYIVELRDERYPEIPIFVDQAHGSHFGAHGFPPNALRLGADVVVHSTHKTLGSLTQTALLHVAGNRVDLEKIRQSLELLQTSSPNYVLMSSLERVGEHVQDVKVWDGLYAEVLELHTRLENKIRILGEKDRGKFGIDELDWLKILINTADMPFSCKEIVELLRNEYGIEPELWDDENILFMLGIGSKPEEISYLSKSLESMLDNFSQAKNYFAGSKGKIKTETDLWNYEEIPILRITPREAWMASRRKIALRDSVGLIAGETISAYPPGIPIIAAGEEISSTIADYLAENEKRFRFQGWQGNGVINIIDI